jgi:hypothetical protein
MIVLFDKRRYQTFRRDQGGSNAASILNPIKNLSDLCASAVKTNGRANATELLRTQRK